MALIKCTECKREISDQAEFCPHCGFPIKPREPVNKAKDIITFKVRGGEDSFVAQEIVALTFWSYKSWVKILVTLICVGIVGSLIIAGLTLGGDLGEGLLFGALGICIYFIPILIGIYLNRVWIVTTGGRKRYGWSLTVFRDAVKRYRDFLKTADHVSLDQASIVRVYSHLVAPKRIASFEKRHWFGLGFFLLLFLGMVMVIFSLAFFAGEDTMSIATVLLIIGILSFIAAFSMIGWCIRIRGVGGLLFQLVMSGTQADWFFKELEEKLKGG